MATSSSSTASECFQVDNTVGPWAGDCRGGFDFTLRFEESILTILPWGVVLLLLPSRVWFLLKRTKKVAIGGLLPTIKTSAWIGLGALQLVSLILWTSPSAARTHTSLAAAAITLLATLALCFLSYVEHDRTVRPSTFLSTVLFFTLLFDIARARTLWLRQNGNVNLAIAEVFTASVVIKAVVLLLEAARKRRLLRPEYQSYPPEATSGIYARSFFIWLNSLIRRGYGNILAIDDLFALDKHLKSSYLQQRFTSAWNKELTALRKPTNPYSLLFTSFGVLKWPVLQTFPARLCLTFFNFCQPFLINRAITLSQEAISDGTTQIGYGLIAAYVIVYIGIAVSMGQYQHRTYRTITMIRGGLISMIYRKTGVLCLKDVDPATSMTVMSADIERIVQGWQTMHETWASFVEVGIAIYLLERQLGVACVVPVVVSIVSLIASLVAMSAIMSRQALWLEAIEKRISATSAMLASMKGIKMCGLKDTLLNSLQKLRVDELDISKKFRKLLIWNMVFAYLTQVFAPVLTFVIFSVAGRNGDNKTLNTAVAFTSLSLFALLSEPLASLVMALATFLGAVGSFTRIQQFVQSEERTDTRKADLPMLSEKPESGFETDAITVKGANFGWDPEKAPLLKDISVSVPFRKLTMLVGPVGCGKSTLLLSLLGEVPTMAGSVSIRSTDVGYCAQKPWHMNGTIREAIIGTARFDKRWYDRVVAACALVRDFTQLQLGDASPIGSAGTALSGGQGQRIALARAVYARRKVVIMDDSFSGLDNTTEHHVFHSLLGVNGILRELGSTVLLVSSSAKRLPFSDHIVVLDAEGRIAEQGTFAELEDQDGYVASFNLPRADWTYNEGSARVTTNALTAPAPIHLRQREFDDMSIDPVSSGVATPANKEQWVGKDKEAGSGAASESGLSDEYRPEIASTAQERPDAEIDGVSRRTGDVQIYLYYIKSVGWWATLVFVVTIIGFAFCVSFPNIWVQWWAAANEAEPNSRLGYWLGVYAALGGIAIVCLFLSCWQMIVEMVPRSGKKFHFDLLKTVLSAPMSFFTETDTGTTLNRFSQDLQLIDMELPVSALNTFATFVLCIAQMALIGVGSYWAAISFPILLLALFVVQKIYLRTSRQLRLLDIEAKAPLYSLFEETLSGLATIRAFGWQTALQDKNEALLDRSQRPFYLLYAVQRWLTLVLDLILAAVAVLLIVLVVKLRGTISAGGIGLALLNVIQFGQSIKLLVTFWTNLETHIGSVARIRSFTANNKPEDLDGEDNAPPPNWPSAGAIHFSEVSAAYKPDQPVLNSVTLDIKAGEKIGIVGRTGSGKTSLVTSLFRLLDLQSGSIMVDGVDIATLPRQEVRQRIVAVPQHPFLLKGSVRLNIDPFGGAQDKDIIEALQSVQLMTVAEEHGGLDADVDELKLSGGQMQLFCLARAMLRPGTILVLDEATSSVDAKTDEMMQRLIRRKFASRTIIAVAHRLETIMDFDRVAVLDGGKLLEFDNPYALLEMPGSAFGKLYDAAMAREYGTGSEDEEWDEAEFESALASSGAGTSTSGQQSVKEKEAQRQREAEAEMKVEHVE